MSVKIFSCEAEKFISKIKIGDECWEWSAGLSKNGYGLFNRGNRKTVVFAHRYSFALFNKQDVDKILLNILHKCDNRKCCNPLHLFEGTLDENNKDRAAKGRVGFVGFIYEEDKIKIKELYNQGKAQNAIAKQFDVDQSWISRIVNNKEDLRR